MAWEFDLLDATWRGIKFDSIAIDDAFDHDLAQHKFPYQDGAEIENMGRNPRTASITAFFWTQKDGDDYELRLQRFLDALADPSPGEFVHPVFGIWPQALAQRGSVRHEAEKPDQATVTFDLIESQVNQPLFQERTPQQKAEAISQRAQAARTASGSTLSHLIAKVRQLNPLSQLTALRQALLGPLFQLKALAGGIMTAGLDVINYPASLMNDIASLAGGVANLGGFTSSTVLGDYRSAVSRLTQAFGLTNNTVVSYDSDGHAVPTATMAGTNPTQPVPHIDARQPTQTQTVYAVDLHMCIERVATIADAAAEALYLAASDMTAGNSANLHPEDSLSPADVETIVNFARAEIDVVIQLARVLHDADHAQAIIEPLKDTALALQEAAEALVVLRPPLITRAVDAEMPLRLLAHHWYGDHTRAVELQRLNGLRNPNFLTAHQALLTYAQ
ncbi:MAG: DNA circularization N-terminal domain-containing protein [Methylobacter tundripaludum]|nr:DNA circularization N-terminal domain-containing protein [Methylobacter tundripaludum]